MKTKRPQIQAVLLLTLTALSVAGCQSMRPVEDPTRELRERIAPALGLRFEGDLTQGEERNFFGIRSDEILLSRRSDSLTYFVQDENFGLTREGGIFAGGDDELLARGRTIATRLGVPANEINEASVLQVMNTVATIGLDGEVRREEPQRGERYAQLTRSMGGVPIFSSGVQLALDREGNIGFLELHWPEISTAALDKARAMQQHVERGWDPPELEEAYVESVEVGVVHSPAVAFVMDVRPVIRVVYAPTDRSVGKKPVLFLDTEGNPVPQPRQFEYLEVLPEKSREVVD